MTTTTHVFRIYGLNFNKHLQLPKGSKKKGDTFHKSELLDLTPNETYRLTEVQYLKIVATSGAKIHGTPVVFCDCLPQLNPVKKKMVKHELSFVEFGFVVPLILPYRLNKGDVISESTIHMVLYANEVSTDALEGRSNFRIQNIEIRPRERAHVLYCEINSI